ncbi:MAG: hypothetical protein K8R58_02680 [Bacteroidales bacterium]|nr:hypothetical protein [Bacteroidales bacterium]
MSKINKTEFISCISEITGCGFENSMYKVNHFKPPVIDMFDNINFNALNKFSSINHISKSTMADSVSKMTGRSFENVLMEMNKISM